ncbi:ATP-dependent helicase [bacterium]|nr:ATP-dependent helicase [bacterium]
MSSTTKAKKMSKNLKQKLAPTTNGASHLIVSALAGTGKTTTLIEGLRLLQGETPTISPSDQQQAVWDSMLLSADAKSFGFVAFNKSIATELQHRVPAGVDAMTMHSMGNKAVRSAFGKFKVSSWRVTDLISEILERDVRELRKHKFELLKATEKLVGLVKMNLTDTDCESLSRLASHYDIDLNGNQQEVFDLVPQVIERCKDVAKDGRIDFNDMIWLPVVLQLALPKYDLLLVDECQDLNRCQQELVMRAGKRLILCGDVNQAIYGFAGADSASMKRMEETLGDTKAGVDVLPLTVTRRCGKAIVEEARKIVPEFEAHEDNPPGALSSSTLKDYVQSIQSNDMVLSRVNAPLVSECFKFLKEGRKAIIRGRDIGQGLVTTVKKMKADNVADLIGKLSDWLHNEVAKENKKKFASESRLINLQDRYDCLCCFADNCETVDTVISKIEAVFTDDKDNVGILLSSIHKAKGLEADRVFIMQTKAAPIPHPMAKIDWQREQEYNLLYVAVTRAINELVYIND